MFKILDNLFDIIPVEEVNTAQNKIYYGFFVIG